MTGGPLLNAARRYQHRGWQVLPLRANGKAPHPSVGKGWTDFRCEENDLEEHFGTNDRNIGVLLGEPSGGLVDVDLDCDEAVKQQPELV